MTIVWPSRRQVASSSPSSSAPLAELVVLFSTTESPTEGPASIVLVLGLLALPVVLAAVLIARILAGGAGHDEDRFLP